MTTRIGHRGAAGHEPENTLRSIKRAVEMGVDLIEFDVQRTRDGHLVLMHDKRVDRTTNGRGYVSEMSLAEIQTLDAGKGERVPTLEEVLRFTAGRVGLMLEIITPGVARQVVESVRSGYEGPVVYASFHHNEVAEVRRLVPGAATLTLIEAVPVRPTEFAKEAGATHVGIALDSTTGEFVAALQSDGLKVFVYTANDARDIAWLHELKVDGIVSDYPERLANEAQ